MRRPLIIAAAALGALVPAAAGAAPAPRGVTHSTGLAVCPPMPRTALPGYTITAMDSFNAASLNTKVWFRWEGQPGGDPYGWWRTYRSVASRGKLRLAGSWVTAGGNPKWAAGGEVTSGVGTRHLQTYGEYRWCMRSDAMPGTETDVLLWPSSNRLWPPEVDLYESSGDPTSYATTLHYGTAAQNYVEQQQVSGFDATRWHVFTATWKPGQVFVYEDGIEVSSIIDAKNVPSVPMRLDFQTQSIAATPTIGSTVVDWVVEYAPKR